MEHRLRLGGVGRETLGAEDEVGVKADNLSAQLFQRIDQIS